MCGGGGGDAHSRMAACETCSFGHHVRQDIPSWGLMVSEHHRLGVLPHTCNTRRPPAGSQLVPELSRVALGRVDWERVRVHESSDFRQPKKKRSHVGFSRGAWRGSTVSLLPPMRPPLPSSVASTDCLDCRQCLPRARCPRSLPRLRCHPVTPRPGPAPTWIVRTLRFRWMAIRFATMALSECLVLPGSAVQT